MRQTTVILSTRTYIVNNTKIENKYIDPNKSALMDQGENIQIQTNISNVGKAKA